jgi:hypothetical protein
MSILIDISGNLINTSLIGLLVHVTANMNDEKCRHTTTIRHEEGDIDRSSVEVTPLGNLAHNKYLVNRHLIPSYLLNPAISLLIIPSFFG